MRLARCFPAIALALLGSLQPAAAEAPPAPPPLVIITRAAPPPPGTELLLPGTIEAWQETAVHARTSGYVRRWLPDIGHPVKAGELLVELDTPEVDQALLAAKASVAQAEANLELARINHQRWQTLVARQTVPAYELDERAATFKARTADLAAAIANRQRYEELSGFKRVVAPFAGTVTQRSVEIGQLVDAGRGAGQALYRVAETGRLKIRVGVPQSYVRSMAAGLLADVTVAEFPGRRFGGKVSRTAGAIEPASRTLLTEIELPNADGQLVPGLYAQVLFKVPVAIDVVMVPTNTVRIDAKGARVGTVGEDGVMHWVPVGLGRNVGTQYEVLQGLAVKAPVILNPSDLLQDGMKVEAKELPPPAKP